MAHILVVEDDCAINELIARNLKLVGHSYSQAFDGEEAVRMASVKQTDLILLDVMLPGLDGFEVIKKIAPTPVIFLTAKAGLEHRLRGLSLGADDYIAKPFEMLEMLARVEAVLRRTKKSASAFSLDNVTVDLLGRKVTAGGENIELSHQEYELLEVLIANRNIAMSREKLLELAWGYDYLGESRTVDTHIQKLRSKLGWENRIKTVYKLGYRLEV
ncbi:MAG: response regulator transcription factor [Clostridiales bacterium]|jgi:DNA-binding response OmpR family regulator|nr:response regulator transcription factor [Clostridiales bacterium]